MKDFYIYGEITDKTAAEFAAFLNENQNITLHINSAGGEIFSAIAISNLIKNRADVKISVDGLAASAATLICSGGNVTAAKNSMFMLHLPLVGLASFYNAVELSAVQKGLEAVTEAVNATYESKLKLTKPELTAMMTAETWLTAAQAKELGLVDEISGEEIEMQLANDVLLVNNVAFTNIKNLPVNVEKVNRVLIAEKLTASVLTAERGRVAALMAMKTSSPARNSIINKAIETGKTAEEITPFLEALPKDEKPRLENLEQLYGLLKDNLESGASEVQGSLPKPEPQAEMTAFSENVAKFANEMLKGGIK